MFEVARVSQVSGEVPHRPRCVRGATKPGNHVECLGGHDETVRTEHGSRRIEGPARGGRVRNTRFVVLGAPINQL